MSTLAQLRSRAMVRYRDLSGITVTSTTWSEYLNEGYEAMVADSPHWPFRETSDDSLTVLAGANEVTLPTNGWRVLTVWNATDGWRLEEVTGRTTAFDRFPDRAGSTGAPSEYRLFGNKVQVYPWAEVATDLIVEYASTPSALSDGDSPVFPSEYHNALMHYALSQAFSADGDLKMAGHHDSMFARILEQMRTDLLGARGDSYPQIVESW